MLFKFGLFILGAVLTACTTLPYESTLQSSEIRDPACQVHVPHELIDDPLKALEMFTTLYEARCDKPALRLGRWIRQHSRDKSYSVSREIASVFMPEDVSSVYVLESYERAYLAVMMASIYLRQGDRDAAAVELRKSYGEGKALLYNYGDDPANQLLLAVFWENLGEPDSARPFWRGVSEASAEGSVVRKFADTRILEIDRGGAWQPMRWRVQALGRFPELDWSISFANSGNGYYEIKTKDRHPAACRSDSAALISTESWLKKIRLRYEAEYHPLLNAKSWVRFPIGVAYGLTAFTAGAGVAVGGCALDASAGSRGNSPLCETAVRAGVYLMASSVDVTSFALRPDIRHWRQVPIAFYVSRADSSEDVCTQSLSARTRGVAVELF